MFDHTRLVWPFLGRAPELERIRAAVLGGAGAGALLVGDPGVGKTSLAEAAARLTGGSPARAVPAGVASPPLSALAHLLPTTGERLSPLDLRRHAIEALGRAEAGTAAVVLADDAHLLDDASAGVIRHVAVVGAARLVMTVARGAALPEPLVRLLSDGLVEEVAVQPLRLDDRSLLVEEALGGHVEGWTLHELCRLAGGNLGYLKGLVEGAVRQGGLTAVDGVWRWDGRVALTERARALVDRRLSGRSPEEAGTVRALALAGSLEVSILASFAPAELLEEQVERQGIVIARHGRRIQAALDEPLVAEVVRTAMSDLTKTRIFNELADALEATGLRRRTDAVRLATWRINAGQGMAPELLASAVDFAFRNGDYPLAEQLTKAAVEAGGGMGSRHALARALVGLERADEAESILGSLDTSTATSADRLEVALTRSLNLFLGLDRADQAEDVLSEVEAGVGDRGLGEITATRSFFRYSVGRLGDACRLAADALGRGDAAQSPRAAARAHGVMAASLALMGRPDDAIAAADQAIALFDRGDDTFFPSESQLQSVRWDGLWFAGRLDQAEELGRRRYREAIEAESGKSRGPACLQLGLCARARGRVRTAVDWLQEAVLLVADSNRAAVVPALAALAQAAALAGEIEVALSAIGQCKRNSRRTSPVNDARTYLTEAWIAASGGDLHEARRLAVAGAEAARQAEATALQVIALHDLARLGDPATASRSLPGPGRGLQGSLLPLLVTHIEAMDRNDSPALDQAALRFEGMGMLLLGAEAAALASTSYRRSRQPGRARASKAHARKLAAQCEGARTPGLQELESPDLLTVREREVAALAARGLTNLQIARELTISVRTVDNILHRLYAKLAIRGRNDLATVL